MEGDARNSYLSSIPGMLESILEGMAAPESALSEPPGW
ncbi:hypothetical protein SynROS8604_01136 [Synechococcus sp. ROS8604]|nr:hypothetical protein SynROS8604_01136 [Synechococcus sp. ROS8604]